MFANSGSKRSLVVAAAVIMAAVMVLGVTPVLPAQAQTQGEPQAVAAQAGCSVELQGGADENSAAPIGVVGDAIEANPLCTNFVLRGHFDGKGPLRITRPLTLTGPIGSGIIPPVLWGSTVLVHAVDVTVQRLEFREQLSSAIWIGRLPNSTHPGIRADGARIEFNKFSDTFKSGSFGGGVIRVAGVDNSVPSNSSEPIRIRFNEILNFGRNDRVYRGDDPNIDSIPTRFFHGIMIGQNRLRFDGSFAPYTLTPARKEVTTANGSVSSEPVRVIVNSNIIETSKTWGSGYTSAIQAYDPTYIAHNCIAGTDIGIEIKSNENIVTGNRLYRVVGRNRHASGAALYQRDGDLNRYTNNLVVQSGMGFEAYSGSHNVFSGNLVMGSRRAIGRIHGAYHSGNRAEENLADINLTPAEAGITLEEPDHLTGQTSFRFAAEHTLIANNSFVNNNGGLLWKAPEAGRLELPNNFYLVRNIFDRGRKADTPNQTVMHIRELPRAATVSLEDELRAQNFQVGNVLDGDFSWTRGATDNVSRSLTEADSVPREWNRFTGRGEAGAKPGVAANAPKCF